LTICKTNFVTFSRDSKAWIAFPNENVVKEYILDVPGVLNKGMFELKTGLSFSSGYADSAALNSLYNGPKSVLAYFEPPER
jgi:hypothetical protein